jgi:hypothetical protein
MGSRAIIIVGIALVAIIGLGLLGVAFAQMESMTIEGLKHPYVNSVFNVGVDVDGVSRASGGIFRTVMTLFEKDSGQEILAVPDYLRSGVNTIQINMIRDWNTDPLKEGLTYVLQIQHVNIISQFEFIPKAYESTQAQDQVSEIDQNQVEDEISRTIYVHLEDGVTSSDDIK